MERLAEAAVKMAMALDEITRSAGVVATFRGNSLGVWEHARDHRFDSIHVFFIFNADGTRRAKEVVRTEIHLDGKDTFEGFAAFDLFAADGTPISGVTGCPINMSGTRLR